MTKDTILVVGASGQIGTELVIQLRSIYGNFSVVASDLKSASKEVMESGPFENLDIMDESRLHEVIKKHKVTQIYLLAALLSATAEKNIELGWALNMRSLSHVLDLARYGKIKKIYWPSSIAVFGPSTPKINTSQYTVMEPNTVYGISKQAGERWCEYYHNKFDVIVSNPPYIKRKDFKNLDDDVKKFEPKLALDGGNDGLDVIKKVIYKSKSILKIKGMLALEIGNEQFKKVSKILKSNRFKTRYLVKDYRENIRCILSTLEN